MTLAEQRANGGRLGEILMESGVISEEVLARSVTTFQCKFWQAYGLTETTGAVVNLAPEDHDVNGPNRHRLRSCGLPGPGVEVRIVDPDFVGTDAALRPRPEERGP